MKKNGKNTLKFMFRFKETSTEQQTINLFYDLKSHSNLVDRTKIFYKNDDIKNNLIICREIPKVSSMSLEKPLSQIIRERAEELKVKENLHLFWSGGIDSTTAFYALLNSGVNFTVIMNDNSKAEYPKLFSQIVEGIDGVSYMGSLNDTKFNLNQFTIDNPNVLFVTGELGDQIFGKL